ncbi:hepatic triacylglycerol lipase-like [Hyposmocoma kahamanoa]|uniref:hepatic triacylglycerol lipase-like n=1 Tax=Hyposmocoma kahamanoa TaxID=1477025 RepID=UPI000E6D814F|nr:hepatic triacylglycerol lipase-like [Hyposmocoma kahamanoa]
MFKFLVICYAALTVSLGARKSSQLYTSTYMLYTKDNYKSGKKVEANRDSVGPLPINAMTDCAIIVHGHGGSGSHSMSTVLRDAFLTNGTTNVIVVDWAIAASVKEYALAAVPAVGENIIELLKLLVKHGKISVAKLHLVGFDVGAHVVGCVGRGLKGIARITALNPIGGGREWVLSGYHVRPEDALYVEVIHTEVSEIGIPSALGDVDFYPHGGIRQPGCGDIECSHNRAWQLFAASLTHGGIMGHRCDNVDEAIDTRKPCTGFTLAMGNNELVKYGSGAFTVHTNALYPYRCKIKCGFVDRVLETIVAMVFGLQKVDTVFKP